MRVRTMGFVGREGGIGSIRRRSLPPCASISMFTNLHSGGCISVKVIIARSNLTPKDISYYNVLYKNRHTSSRATSFPRMLAAALSTSTSSGHKFLRTATCLTAVEADEVVL